MNVSIGGAVIQASIGRVDKSESNFEVEVTEMNIDVYEDTKNLLLRFIALNCERLYERLGDIAADEEVSSFRVPNCQLSIPWVGGGSPSVRALVEIWGRGLWRPECPKCGRKAFLHSYRATSWLSYCPDCGEVFVKKEDFEAIRKEGLTILTIIREFRSKSECLSEIANNSDKISELDERISEIVEATRKALKKLDEALSARKDCLIMFEYFGQSLDELIEKRRPEIFLNDQRKERILEIREQFLTKAQEICRRLEKILK